MTTASRALCHASRDLRESHLIPKALFRLIRDTDPIEGVRPDPLHITKDATIRTSTQFTCRLLCRDCEQLFSKRGERVVIKECCRSTREFILRDKLRAETPFVNGGTSASFSGASVPSIDVEAYRYFVASIIWRASVGRWPAKSGMKGKHFFDPTTKETFRRYLLGETAFPPNARVMVFVANDETPAKFITLPVSNAKDGYRENLFNIPGAEHRLLVGEQFDVETDSIFNSMSSNIVFDLREHRNSSRFDGLYDMVRNSPAKGKLRVL